MYPLNHNKEKDLLTVPLPNSKSANTAKPIIEYLGVVIDEHLTWKEHINDICIVKPSKQ